MYYIDASTAAHAQTSIAPPNFPFCVMVRVRVRVRALGIKKSAWNSDGFCDLLNINRSLHKHSDSSEHLKCVLQLKQIQKNQSTISDSLKENSRLYIAQYNEDVRLNRLVLRIVVDAVLFLARQELAFRGHDENQSPSNGGNFKELLSLLISTSPLDIQQHYEKIKAVFTEDSEALQNEIIECISDYTNEYIKLELTSCDFFSVRIDDTTDVTQKSQCSLIVRLINSNGELVERFLGFCDVSCDRTSEALFNLVDTVLGPFGYKGKLVGQCYDGASVMSGHLNDLQKKVKEVAPQAISIHCLAHRLDLVLQDSLKQVSQCRVFFAVIRGIPSFFHLSVKRSYVANTIVGKLIPTTTDTRWKLVKVVAEEWNDLKAVFEAIANDFESDQTAVRLSNGFLNYMKDFEFAFLVIVFNEIFQISSILFDILQKKSLDVIFCEEQSRNMMSCQKMNFFRSTSNYFEILDVILMQVSTRFQDIEQLQFCSLADTSKFLQYSIAFPSDALAILQKTFPHLFKVSRLKTELELLYADYEYQSIPLIQALKLLRENKDVFEESYRLFSLVVTLPSTNVAVERSFPALNCVKENLCNSMAQGRSTSLACVYIHKDLLHELIEKEPFHDDIIDKFSIRRDRQINLVYKK
ncbi:hypothetical protein ANN_09018 [Periplaneta americana]|uniref:Zinc finger MYM-type protein 1-like n=1 Tax=Periplaneta americana TaxID=6978 RepID=A0ABQ8TNS5_PERAM|nr:hypothetical protein ANN_09018 [Periplaneta americana]